MLTSSQLQKRTGRGIPFVDKPSGYSLFPCELFPVPKSWAATTCNLVTYHQHEHGGHFAVCEPGLTGYGVFANILQAMERPEDLLADVEEYIKKAWKGAEKTLPVR